MIKCKIHGERSSADACKDFDCDDISLELSCLESAGLNNLEGDEIEELKHCSNCEYRNCINCINCDD